MRFKRKLNRNYVENALKFFHLETIIILVISMLINIMIIGAFKGLESGGPLIELADAGYALERNLGSLAKYIWALGLFSSGQSATLAGTLTGQYILEGFLKLQFSKSKRILISRMLTLLPCIFIAKYAQVQIVYIMLNIVQFIQLPFVLIPLFKIIDNKEIMGGARVGKTRLNILKRVSMFFVLMNLGQIISTITVQFNLIVFILLLLSIYVYLLWRLYLKKLRKQDNMMIELCDTISLDC